MVILYVYLLVNWYILLPNGVFYDHLLYISRFWLVTPRKIWQPCFSGTIQQKLIFRGKKMYEMPPPVSTKRFDMNLKKSGRFRRRFNGDVTN
jgi:hypothetical protein